MSAADPTPSTTLGGHLRAEQEGLDQLLSTLDEEAFATPTPASGWDVRDQVIHLAFGEELAHLAARDPDGFRARLTGMAGDLEGTIAEVHERGRASSVDELMAWWRRERTHTLEALVARDPAARVPWAGPDLSVTSFLRARLMETFAHGQDIRDGLGSTRAATPGLFEVAHLGVRTRGFSYQLRGLTVPDVEVGVVLDGPGGPRSWGPADAADRVTGDVLDFCLVVTRRRHPADTDLRIVGAAAAEWMQVAQAYLGPPADHRPPGTFPRVSPRVPRGR